jgi:hypothetical protein
MSDDLIKGAAHTSSLYIDDDKPNSKTSDLDEGLGDDAYPTYDIDDSTLPADNDLDTTETGIDSVDADNLNPEQNKMGDVIIDNSEVDNSSTNL